MLGNAINFVHSIQEGLLFFFFVGVMDPKYVDSKKQTQGIRRPFGVAGKNSFLKSKQYYLGF